MMVRRPRPFPPRSPTRYAVEAETDDGRICKGTYHLEDGDMVVRGAAGRPKRAELRHSDERVLAERLLLELDAESH